MGILKKSGACFFVGVKENKEMYILQKIFNNNNNNWDSNPTPLELSSFVFHSLYLSLHTLNILSICNLDFV